MTKKLEDLLGISPFDTVESDDAFGDKTIAEMQEDAFVEAAHVMNALNTSEKIDLALTTVTGLSEHDTEMDDIAKKAITSYTELCSIGKNVPDMHIGKIYEVAGQMLKTALEAKEAKVQKKLKIIELQIKKMRVDQQDENGVGSGNNDAPEFDRNELLKHIVDSRK
jgi:S-adenosylmethionine synthetase